MFARQYFHDTIDIQYNTYNQNYKETYLKPQGSNNLIKTLNQILKFKQPLFFKRLQKSQQGFREYLRIYLEDIASDIVNADTIALAFQIYRLLTSYLTSKILD